jgi:RNA polymerase sigma-70 factor (ECF subfamily)
MWLFGNDPMQSDLPENRNDARDRNPSTSSSLLQGARAGENEAWRRLVGLYAQIVYVRCRRAGIGPDDAQDVVQEVFSATAKHLCEFRYRTPTDSFRSWLKTITGNKIADHFRRQGAQPKAEGGSAAQQRFAELATEPQAGSASNSASEDARLQKVLEIAKASVEESTWQAFWQLTVEERTAADVAEQLGMGTKAVYEAKYRVSRLIRKLWGEAT